MTIAIILIVLFIACWIGYMVWASTTIEPVEPPPTPEELMQARLDLHRVESRVDLSLSRQESRRAAAQTKEAIADALDDQR